MKDAWTHFLVQHEGKKLGMYGKHSLIRLMPEAKCNFRVANKKIYRKPTLKFFVRCLPVDRKKKKYVIKMFLAARDRNARRNLSFRRFVRAHAKPPLPGASLKLTQLKSRWAHASATLVLPPSRATTHTLALVYRSFSSRSWNYWRGLSAAHWLPLVIAITISIQSYSISFTRTRALVRSRQGGSSLTARNTKLCTLFVVTITSPRIQRRTSQLSLNNSSKVRASRLKLWPHETVIRSILF